MLTALAFAASFVFVFLKAIQQLNVVHANYVWIMPVSFAMAACEVYTISATAASGWGWIIVPIGGGAGLGAMLAVYIHKRYVRSER